MRWTEKVNNLIGELFNWLGDMRNSKILALLIFFIGFVILLVYVFTGKERGKRLESYKDMPFLDDDEDEPKRSNTVKKDE
jgi:cbb3-type cytochrome oxidase subunit 3